MRNALLFPGQGSQFPGMLAQLPQLPAVWQVLGEAASILGEAPFNLDAAAALTSTRNVQLALFLAGVASFRLAQAAGARIDVVAGLSVGTFSAAVACGAATFEDLLPVVALRGKLMEEAYPVGHGMTAISGLSFDRVAALVQDAHSTSDPVYVANRYGIKQTIVAGSSAALDRVAESAIRNGATAAKRLDVPCPSHCPLLSSVELKLRASLAAVPFQSPACPYLSNLTTRLVQDAEQVREDLAANAAHPIAWLDGMQLLREQGVQVYIEAFPGHVLSRLVGGENQGSVKRLPMEAGWKNALSLIA